jgi:hypothetical protein
VTEVLESECKDAALPETEVGVGMMGRTHDTRSIGDEKLAKAGEHIDS